MPSPVAGQKGICTKPLRILFGRSGSPGRPPNLIASNNVAERMYHRFFRPTSVPIATRTFRVFVSSTFEDLKQERNALQRVVWPKLRTLCEQHGARFQAI